MASRSTAGAGFGLSWLSVAGLLIRSRDITGEGVVPPSSAIGMLTSRNPPRDPTGDYVQPTWLAWQADGQSNYRVWLSRQLPKIRNRARLEVECEISGTFRTTLSGRVRPTGQTWVLLLAPAIMAVIGTLVMVAEVATAISRPESGFGGLGFVLVWMGLVVFAFRSMLGRAKQAYDALLAELSAAIGGQVTGAAGRSHPRPE